MKGSGRWKNDKPSTTGFQAIRQWLAIGFVTVGMSVWIMEGPSVGQAQSRATVAAGLPYSGMVTDIRERMIEIDGRLYTCDPKVEVFDDEGNRVDLSAIVRNAEVRFRVRQDDVHKIDKIVIYLPR